jgi:hypothetical protein
MRTIPRDRDASGRLSSIEGTPEAPVAPKPAKPKAKKKAAT